MKTFDFGGNQLTGSLLPELANIPTLQTLALGSNNLTGTIPAEFGDFPALVNLYFEANQISGTLPVELGQISTLRVLLAHSNQLTGNIPTEWSGMTSLKWLILHTNQLSGAFPTTLCQLPALERIILNNNGFSGELPECLYNITTLKKMRLNNNGFSGEISPLIGNLTLLDDLRISYNQFEGELPEELGFLSGLTKFYMSDNNFQGCFPASFSNYCGSLAESSFNNNPCLWRNGDFAAFCAGETCAVSTPTLTASQSQICPGMSVTLEAGGGTSYAWSNGESGTSIEVTPSVTTTYTVTITAEEACHVESITIEAEVNYCNPLQSIFIGTPEVTCNEGTPSLVVFTVTNTSDDIYDEISVLDENGDFIYFEHGLNIPPGAIYTVTFTLPEGVECIKVLAENDEVCVHEDICLEVPDCDPCPYLAAYAEPLETEEGCCFSMNVTNDFPYQDFNFISVEILTPGIEFENVLTHVDWGGLNGDNIIILSHDSGQIPEGDLQDVVSFCLRQTIPSGASQVELSIQWITPNEDGVNYVACESTITLECPGCVDAVELDAQCFGEFNTLYTYEIYNNTSLVVDRIILKPRTVGVCFDGSEFPLVLDGLMILPGTSQVITFEAGLCSGGVLSGSFDFEVDLYSDGAQCCHSESYSTDVPQCCRCSTFKSDFGQGISFSQTPDDNCQYILTPRALQSCDEVTWTFSPSGNVDIPAGDIPQPITSMGSDAVPVTFPLDDVYEICISVERLVGGVSCEAFPLETCYQLNVLNCASVLEPDPIILLSPNPVQGDRLNLQMGNTKTNGPTSIQVLDMRGHDQAIRYTKNENNIEFETQKLPPGIYWIKLRFENGETRTQKFVKI